MQPDNIKPGVGRLLGRYAEYIWKVIERDRQAARERDRDRQTDRQRQGERYTGWKTEYPETGRSPEDVPLVEFTYLVSTCMPGDSYRRRLISLLLYLCDVFRVLINSLVC